jgi:hypothetical protein
MEYTPYCGMWPCGGCGLVVAWLRLEMEGIRGDVHGAGRKTRRVRVRLPGRRVSVIGASYAPVPTRCGGRPPARRQWGRGVGHDDRRRSPVVVRARLWCPPVHVLDHPWSMREASFATRKWYARLRVDKIPDTQFSNPNYPNPDPKYPNPNYPITILDSDCKNPKLVWVIRVMFSGTRTTELPEISQIFALLFLIWRHEVVQCHINILFGMN